ncbi:MAG: hypothetical protein JWR69_4558 [Pedosphaera sp.]|nr:hypothetical protein [Pedosphaera sp.]
MEIGHFSTAPLPPPAYPRPHLGVYSRYRRYNVHPQPLARHAKRYIAVTTPLQPRHKRYKRLQPLGFSPNIAAASRRCPAPSNLPTLNPQPSTLNRSALAPTPTRVAPQSPGLPASPRATRGKPNHLLPSLSRPARRARRASPLPAQSFPHHRTLDMPPPKRDNQAVQRNRPRFKPAADRQRGN